MYRFKKGKATPSFERQHILLIVQALKPALGTKNLFDFLGRVRESKLIVIPPGK